MQFRLLLALFFVGCLASAQQTSQQTSQQNQAVRVAGVQTPWDARRIIDGIVQENENFQPVLEAIHPQDWIAQGAPVVYIQQWQQAQQQMHDVVYTAKMLAQKPELLSLAIDAYFRLEALDLTGRSLEEGVRHYADRASADKLSALIAHNFSAREQFRDYLSNLATTQEQNYKVADQEAQRCRGMISREPAPARKKN